MLPRQETVVAPRRFATRVLRSDSCRGTQSLACARSYCAPQAVRFYTAAVASTRLSRAPGERSLYSIPEAAGYLHVSPHTLRSWILGRPYPTASGATAFSPPLIQRPSTDDPRLSFTNLVEANALAAIRRVHGVDMRAVRRALTFAEEKLGIRRLLARKELKTDGRGLFLKRLGEDRELNLSQGGAKLIDKLLEQAVLRLVHDDAGWTVRFFPRLVYDAETASAAAVPGRIAIDPEISFGRPFLARRGVSVAVLSQRFEAGEPISILAEDYGLETEDVEAAVTFAA